MKQTPEDIWKQAVSGNQKAWQKLYELFGTKLYNFFLRNTQNRELASDKVQEVFLKIYKHKGNFQYGTLKTWIFRIAKNLLIDEWRKSKNKEILSEMTYDVKDENTSVEGQVLHDISQEAITKIINEGMLALPQEERLVIGLVYLAGLSVPEFSSIMDIPLGTAKTRVRAARLKLDQILHEKMKLNYLAD